MLGLGDSGVFWAYILTIAAALLCVVYGIVNWNKGAENEAKEIAEEEKWSKKDEKISETL